MVFSLDSASTEPLYHQIRDGLRRDILEGVLRPGQRLPSSRQLARDLGISRITAVAAYAELEAEGLVETRHGAGTYVMAPWHPVTPPVEDEPTRLEPVPAWQTRLAPPPVSPKRARMLREAVRGPGSSEVIPFAWARGDVRLLPADDLRRAISDAVARDGVASLQYEQSEGYPPLRAAVVEYLRQIGIAASPDDVVVTAGAQQALDLVARALIRPGDAVALEEPTYPGAFEVFEAVGAEIVPLPLDGEGLRTDALRRALQGGARLVYTVPTFQNPTGVVTSAARRREIVALAAEFGVPVLEDEYLREVRFGSPIPPPLAAFDQHRNVIHVASFSKSLLPALRLGYVVARGPLRERLIALKRVADAGSSALLQRALHLYLESGALHRHWKRASRVYRRRQAAMAEALRRHFPEGTRWSNPQGGVVMWVRVPDGVSVGRLLDEALAHGVNFAAGEAFFARPADQPYMRLNFAALEEAEIDRGLAVLGRLLRSAISRRDRARVSSYGGA